MAQGAQADNQVGSPTGFRPRLLILTNAVGASRRNATLVRNDWLRLYSGYADPFRTSLTLFHELRDEALACELPRGIQPLWVPSYRSAPDFLRKLAKLTRRIWPAVSAADVVLACMPCLHAVLGLVLARLAGKPAIVLVTGRWTDLPGLPNTGAARWAASFVASLSALLATRLLTQGAALMDEVILPLRSRAVPVNQTTLSQRDFAPLVEKNAQDLTLLCVSRLVPSKRIDVAIQTVRLLRSRGRSARLKIVGDGPERHRLAALAQAAGVDEQVEFCGFVDSPDDLRKHYRDAFALLLPSESEGLNLAVQEAMAAGTPVISTPAGGMKEFLCHERDALVVGEPDPEGFATAVEQLAADPELRLRVAREGQSKVSKCTHEDWISWFRSLTGEVLGEVRPVRG